LNAFYGKSQVVFDLALEVEHGKIVALLGRNGAGKTSTLISIAGSPTISASSERLQLDGLEVSHLPAFKRVRAGISFVPSGSRAFPNLTVHENLAMVRGGANSGRGEWTIQRVYEAFPQLAALRGSSGGMLSGGERQMLAVARALIANPKVLMLDEPSEGLGPIIVRQIGTMLRELADKGLAVLLTEQNHRLALEVSDYANFIEKGQIVWSGDAGAASDDAVVARYLAV
jgi:branched-chain amino acid transport system ATP-binding protein